MIMKTGSHAIGVFDSGIGGLTVMRAIVDALPGEDVIYFGDTARVPYGDKSPDTIIRYSIENAIFLMEHDIKLLVVACNTASAYSLEKLRKIFNIPVIGVIAPAVKTVATMSKNHKIAVLGTKGTILSGIYQQEILSVLPDAEIFPVSCPLFVPLAEEGLLDHPATSLIVEEYLKDIKGKDIDTVVLGCTHYPLLREVIRREFGENVTLVDSATACAGAIKDTLSTLGILADDTSHGSRKYYVSDDPEHFRSLGEAFLGENISDVMLQPK
jgi:glutamate racemase